MSDNRDNRDSLRWTAFLDNPEFRFLYDRDQKGPVAHQIDILLRDINDIGTIDPVVLATKKGQLWGLLAVRDAVRSLSQHEQQLYAEDIAGAEAGMGADTAAGYRPADWPFPRVM